MYVHTHDHLTHTNLMNIYISINKRFLDSKNTVKPNGVDRTVVMGMGMGWDPSLKEMTKGLALVWDWTRREREELGYISFPI